LPFNRAEKRTASSAFEQDYTNEERPKKKRKSTDFKLSQCFLCETQDDESKLRHAMAMKLNARLNSCTKTLNDGRLLSILSASDVVAQELKYHPPCLVALYNGERAYPRRRRKECLCNCFFRAGNVHSRDMQFTSRTKHI